MKLKLMTLISLLFFQFKGIAQLTEENKCLNCLSAANTFYENGDYQSATDLLNACIDSKTLKKNKEDVYRLLGMCYLRMPDKDSAALKVAFRLLKLNPKYQLFPYSDPRDFTNLINSFKVETKLSLGIKIGINYSNPKTVKAYSIRHASLISGGKPGPSYGLNAQFNFKNKPFALNAHLSYNYLTFTQDLTFTESKNEKINYQEEHSSLDLGLILRYYPKVNFIFSPFMGLGLYGSYVTAATSNLDYDNQKLNGQSQNGRDMVKSGIIKPYVMGAVLDLGLKTEIGKGNLEFGFQYNLALTNNILSDNRYNDPGFIFNQQWVDSDIKLNLFNFYAAYSLPVKWHIYRKKKNYKL